MVELLEKKVFLDNDYEIREYYTENGIVRGLISDECTQSLMYLDKERRNELVLDYFKYYNLPMLLNSVGVNCLMLGGGAISYPHYYLSEYKDKKIDIVEKNEKCIEYARKYFYLDELINNYVDRMNVIVDDAVNYIANTDVQYDYIVIDLFNGRSPVKEIYNEDNILNLKRILKQDGVIVINYIILDDLFQKELNNIISIANNYKIIANKSYFNSINNKGNIIILLSNNEINIPNDYEYLDINDIVS